MSNCQHRSEQDNNTHKLAVSVTIHCLIGCVIGESIGLMLGIFLQWPPLQTAIIATALAFIAGFSLTLFPAFKQGLNLETTFKSIWLGETISIGVMEVVMNLVDYSLGGMAATSILEVVFWSSLAAAIIAGFVAGYPINYWMLKNNIKQPCH